jgi:hypothetical protein
VRLWLEAHRDRARRLEEERRRQQEIEQQRCVLAHSFNLIVFPALASYARLGLAPLMLFSLCCAVMWAGSRGVQPLTFQRPDHVGVIA